MSPRTTPPDRSPAETTTYLEIPPAPDVRDPSGTEQVPAEQTPAEPTDPGPSTAVLEPLEIPPAPATIPALPLAPRDPADRPFAHPQRSAPGKPRAWWRRLLRRSGP